MSLSIPATPLNDADQSGLFFMRNQYFNQPSLSISNQLLLLKERRLIIEDPNLAEHILKTIGYYRLKSYFQPFLLDQRNSHNGFKTGTTFSNILHLYLFDRELRLLVIDAIERIEVALRNILSSTMSHHHGPHWYLHEPSFTSEKFHKNFLKEVFDHLKRSQESFVKNYYSRYSYPEHPPSWMVMECLSFGMLSKAYANIRDRRVRKEIGDALGQFSETIKSWIRALTFTRNVCAHHARLWNRFFINKPAKIKTDHSSPANESPFSMQAHIIIQLLNTIDPSHHWKNRLYSLFEKYEAVISFSDMGFSEEWRSDALWLNSPRSHRSKKHQNNLYTPNKETERAIKETRKRKGIVRCKDINDLFRKLNV